MEYILIFIIVVLIHVLIYCFFSSPLPSRAIQEGVIPHLELRTMEVAAPMGPDPLVLMEVLRGHQEVPMVAMEPQVRVGIMDLVLLAALTAATGLLQVRMNCN